MRWKPNMSVRKKSNISYKVIFLKHCDIHKFLYWLIEYLQMNLMFGTSFIDFIINLYWRKVSNLTVNYTIFSQYIT